MVTIGGLMGGAVLLIGSRGPADDPDDPFRPAPVVESMHQFMEYVFEPSYKQLKASLAAEPQEKADWKPVKGGSMVLAEGGNLLLLREPEEGDLKTWQDLSVAVRADAGQLYAAARERDYTAARSAYLAMLKNCNACHREFADGEHQLVP